MSNAQISISNSTPTQLVNDLFLGQGITVSNITFSGDTSQLGSFNNGNIGSPSLGVDSGIVISTGNINDITLGGNQPSTGQFSGPGDPDLLSIAQSIITNPDAGLITSTFDLATLEFDFQS